MVDAIIKANHNLKTSNNGGDWEMVGKDIKSLQALIDKLEVVSKEEKKKTDIITQENTNQVVLDNSDV